MKKFKIVSRSAYNLDTCLFYLDNSLFPRKLFNAAWAKQTSLKFSTFATDFLPENNRVHVNWELFIKVAFAHCSA